MEKGIFTIPAATRNGNGGGKLIALCGWYIYYCNRMAVANMTMLVDCVGIQVEVELMMKVGNWKRGVAVICRAVLVAR